MHTVSMRQEEMYSATSKMGIFTSYTYVTFTKIKCVHILNRLLLKLQNASITINAVQAVQKTALYWAITIHTALKQAETENYTRIL